MKTLALVIGLCLLVGCHEKSQVKDAEYWNARGLSVEPVEYYFPDWKDKPCILSSVVEGHLDWDAAIICQQNKLIKQLFEALHEEQNKTPDDLSI